jgi:hypothetical protein
MIVVGLLLILLAGLVLAGLLAAPGGSTEVEFFGLILPNLPARTLVLVGLVLGLVAAVGVSLMRRAASGWARRRRDRRAAEAKATTDHRDDDPFLMNG